MPQLVRQEPLVGRRRGQDDPGFSTGLFGH